MIVVLKRRVQCCQTRTEFFLAPELKPFRAKARFAVESYLQKQLTNQHDAALTDIAHCATAVLASAQADYLEKFKEYLNDEKVKVPAAFRVHAQTLKKSTRIKAASKSGWSAQFDRAQLGTSDNAEVYFNPEAKTLTFKGLDEATIKEIQNEIESR